MLGLYSIDMGESFHRLFFLSLAPHSWQVLHPFIAPALAAPTITTPPFASSLRHSNTYPSRSSLVVAHFEGGEVVTIES
jgi:hypothetical protein